MYTEEPAEDLTITVEGEDYRAEPTIDLDEDGVDDTAVVETDDGSIAFTDTDSDGQADLMTRLDSDGEIVGQARFDEATGDWVQVDPDSIDDVDGLDGLDGLDGTVEQTADGSGHGAGDEMTVDTTEGRIEVGTPTHDTDADGKADSVVVQDPDGDTVIFTDADEDGDADYATEITEDGRVTISEHAGDGDWTVIERGHLDDDGTYQRAPMDDSPHSESGTISQESDWAHVDPRTGGWIRG